MSLFLQNNIYINYLTLNHSLIIMSTLLSKVMTAALLAGVTAIGTSAQVRLTIDAADRGPAIGDLHYGIFYEEINNAGDGGLYAELIRNRSFEDGAMDYWSRIGNCTITKISTGLMNEAQGAALKVTLRDAGQGVANTGYWGINCVAGDSYSLCFWIKSPDGWHGSATASLKDAAGTTGATVTVSGIEANAGWQKVTATMTATENLADTHFELVFDKAGEGNLDMVSLFPPTYKDRPNGCRRDLAEKLEALRPAFVRFPGGCYIEGDGWVNENRRFEWKKTIGPIEERPGHYNYNWGYPCTDGLGFHEFLQLTEDLGAEPLFVMNVGIGHGWYTDYTDIDEYIQEALDAIEYCNGSTDTKWGALRAANGHPEPFNLRLMEIGNENYNFDDDRSDHYPERYKAFYDAIKARWPEVTLIGNVEAWGTDNPSWRNSFPCEIVDEHYYRSPSWFENQYSKYDSYDRSRPKVYVGEYAVTDGFGTRGHLRAALGEAVYMLGMERNSDMVIMNSYAPIFINEERDGGWVPDMIRFSHSQSYGTPSYWVQQLMPANVGRRNVNWSEEGNMDGAGCRIALSSWSTKVRYDNVRVTDTEGKEVFADDFTASESDAWSATASGWQRSGGMLAQTNGSSQGTFYAGTVDLPSSYTLELDAVKDSGAEGFLVGFNYADTDNYCWWNIGGWNNGQHGLQLCHNGSKSDFDLKAGSIETGRTYRIKIEVDGAHVKCWLDGTLVHDVSLPVHRKVYVASSIDDATKTMYVKIVNTSGEARTVDMTLRHAGIDGAEVTVLTSASDLDENSADDPMKVSPAAGAMESAEGNRAVYEAPAYSLSIIKLSLNDIDYTDESGTPPTEEQIAAVTAELNPVICKLRFLHADTSLPMSTASGATVEWNLKDASEHVAMAISRFSSTLEVTKANNSDRKLAAGTLVATVSYPDGARGDIEIPVTLAPADGMYGYLYTFMNPNYEITNYALGTKESYGKKFDVLLDGAEIFDTKALAPIEGGTRDAYMARGERADEYFMVTTDMSNIRSGMWNNHGIDRLRSPNMIHWESTAFDFNKGKSIFSDPEATTDGYRTDAEYANITRVWAPQFIWDAEKNAYLVYYSILSSNPGDNHDRMFYSYADRDFKTLTQPRLFYDPGYAVIDADILYSEYDGLYHMMIKKEGAGAASTGIFEYTSPKLLGEPWTEVMHMRAEGDAAVEGPTHIRRIDEDIYNLYYMRYDSEYTYKVVDINHMGTGYSSSTKLSGTGSFQHGSMMTVTEEEYTVLDTWSKIETTIKRYEQLGDDFSQAIAAARKAIDSNRTVADLYEALPAALEALQNAYQDDYVDVTERLTNADFNGNTGTGWTGSSFTATSAGVAEFWNKVFDTYQVLTDMPAGKYRLEIQGFYRYGYQDASRTAHENGTEQLLAKFYMNDAEGTFMSLYDTTLPTVPDNVGQSHTAFNVNNLYHNTPIYTELTESGDLRIGFKKTRAISGDWCCFDNIRLYYKGASSGIGNVTVENSGDNTVDVYSVTGALLRRGVARDNATEGLAPGVYIVGTEKMIVR